MVAKLVWNGPVVKKQVANAVLRGVKAATMVLYTASRKAASVPNTGKASGGGRKRGEGGRFIKGQKRRTRYLNSSKPGEPPRRRTGFGQKNIVCGWIKTPVVEGRVGYTRNARYMLFHELGINYRRAGRQQRPTIVPSFQTNLANMRSAFQQFSKMGGGK